MIYSEYKGVKIACLAASVPENRVDITAMANDPNEDPKFVKSFIRKTGIVAKHKCGLDQTAADFSYSAAKQIEATGKFKPEEIGVLVNITQNPDYRTPSTALALHKRLGLTKNCLAFDVNLGCSGFVYGVSLAASLLKTSDAAKALIFIGDTLARSRKGLRIDQRSSNTTLLFGDASAAVLLEKDKNGNIKSALMSDGTGHKVLSTPYNAWKHPVGPESIPGDDIAVFNFTINEVPELLKEFTAKVGSNMGAYDALGLHQANLMILKRIGKKTGFDDNKKYCETSGNADGKGSSIVRSFWQYKRGFGSAYNC